MRTKQETNKLVKTKAKSNYKKDYKKWSHLYTKLLTDSKIGDKFRKKLVKINKGRDKDKQITQVKAVSEALVMWMEKNPI